MLCGTIHKPPNLSRSKLSGSNMTAAPLFDSQETSHGFATQSVAPLYAPRVTPLDGPVGNLSFFATLLRNPLRIIPASVYEEGIVFAGRTGRAVCWITETTAKALTWTLYLLARAPVDKKASQKARSKKKT